MTTTPSGSLDPNTNKGNEGGGKAPPQGRVAAAYAKYQMKPFSFPAAHGFLTGLLDTLERDGWLPEAIAAGYERAMEIGRLAAGEHDQSLLTSAATNKAGDGQAAAPKKEVRPHPAAGRDGSGFERAVFTGPFKGPKVFAVYVPQPGEEPPKVACHCPTCQARRSLEQRGAPVTLGALAVEVEKLAALDALDGAIAKFEAVLKRRGNVALQPSDERKAGGVS